MTGSVFKVFNNITEQTNPTLGASSVFLWNTLISSSVKAIPSIGNIYAAPAHTYNTPVVNVANKINQSAEENEKFNFLLEKLKELNIDIPYKVDISKFISLYPEVVETLLNVANFTREKFNQEEISLEPHEELDSYLSLVVKQNINSDLNNIFYEVIEFSAKEFSEIETQANLFITKDYDLEYTINEQSAETTAL